jgi:iron complex transport system ATP-binding protein
MKMSVESLVQGYDGSTVIEDIDFQTCTGNVLSILGPNGSGKSTLIKTLCNLNDPMSGRVNIDDRNIKDYSRADLSKILGYVPQYYNYSQFTTVLDTVLMGRRPYINWDYTEEDLDMAERSMTKMNVLDLASRYINEISGGQLQRVFIARTLCQNPNFYIFDEPTSSLDLRHQIETMKIMREMVHGQDRGMIIALHDLNLALRYSDKVLMISNKKIYSYGAPEETITPESIKDVYGVEAEIIKNEKGPFVLSYDSC